MNQRQDGLIPAAGRRMPWRESSTINQRGVALFRRMFLVLLVLGMIVSLVVACGVAVLPELWTPQEEMVVRRPNAARYRQMELEESPRELETVEA